MIADRCGNQRGSALLGALIVSVVLGLMTVGYLSVISTVMNNGSQALNDAKAFYAGESGLLLGKEWFFQNVSQTTSLMEGAVLSNVITDAALSSFNGYSVQVDIIKNSTGVTVRSTVNSTTRLGYNKVVSQDAAVGSGGAANSFPFAYAGFGRDAVTMSGNGATDSYNSSVGFYGGTNVGSMGNVGTNGTGAGVVSLGGNATIKGSAETGVGGTVTLAGNAKVLGATTHNCAKNYPSVVVPPSLTGLASGGNYSLTGNGSATISQGKYKYSSFSVASNGKLTITGVCTLYVTGTFKTAGNGKITISSGASLTLYVDGQTDLGGNGVVNSTNLPANFIVCSTYSGATDGVKISGNGALYGGIYAPDSEIKISGNGENYGALISKAFTVPGNGNIHYDTALQNIGVSSVGAAGGVLVNGSWKVTNVTL
jgi:Tfp pilus assembly protein PilX